jgi:FkbM family methyltransferase
MQSDLIYDVGLHDGLDTIHYLAKGFRVVAIDANPAMINAASRKLANYVGNGTLVLLNRAIGEATNELPFWVSDHSDWSSFDESIAKRHGTPATKIMVKCQPFRDILSKYGIPFYLKVDIEGDDWRCINDLEAFEDRPRYLSWEASYPRGIDELRAVRDLGYTKFKIILQTDFTAFAPLPLPHVRFYNRVKRKLSKITGLHSTVKNYSVGSSGPFGEETPGRWYPWTYVAEFWRNHCSTWKGETMEELGTWYDFHAARD